MTFNQIRWAARHDWFVTSDGASVLAREVVSEPNGAVTDRHVEFGDFRKLRDWAGYGADLS